MEQYVQEAFHVPYVISLSFYCTVRRGVGRCELWPALRAINSGTSSVSMFKSNTRDCKNFNKYDT